MKRYVLDSYALLAYCEGESGAQSVADLLKKALSGEAEIFVCTVNWGECYYITLREGGAAKAELFQSTLAKYPIALVDADMELTLQAAQFKAFHKLSYADAYAAATAVLKKATLVTGDKEFEALENRIRIQWLR